MELNLVKRVLDNGGMIRPLIIPSEQTNGSGLCNPSVFVDGEDILVNIRHVNYDMYHSEFNQKYPSWYGPLIYLHKEDDVNLRTQNFLAKLTPELDIEKVDKIDTSDLDIEPVWSFIGLEDGRLFRWDDKLYICGVRRDTTENGEGRMEFSEIEYTSDGVKEISRHRIEVPNSADVYCEKNWMPILDKPFHFVKWTNPTKIVKVDLETSSSRIVYKASTQIPTERDFRGNTHVVEYKGNYLALIHEVDFWHNENKRKDSQYHNRFILWDKDWNIIRASQRFKFMDNYIEFSCGLAKKGDDFLISFGAQDNTAYILRANQEFIEKFINE